jgi:hypothetical protein
MEGIFGVKETIAGMVRGARRYFYERGGEMKWIYQIAI